MPRRGSAGIANNSPRWWYWRRPRGGSITANSPYPTDFLLDNLKIQAAVIETTWRSGVLHVDSLGEACMFALESCQPGRRCAHHR
jgi:hypothetical protein